MKIHDYDGVHIQTTTYMESPGLSSVIKLFSEALCATREKIIQKEDYELKEKKMELTGYETDPFI